MSVICRTNIRIHTHRPRSQYLNIHQHRTHQRSLHKRHMNQIYTHSLWKRALASKSSIGRIRVSNRTRHGIAFTSTASQHQVRNYPTWPQAALKSLRPDPNAQKPPPYSPGPQLRRSSTRISKRAPTTSRTMGLGKRNGIPRLGPRRTRFVQVLLLLSFYLSSLRREPTRRFPMLTVVVAAALALAQVQVGGLVAMGMIQV